MYRGNSLSADLFRGQVVFVTGGSSGINLAIASRFAALGAAVAICGRDQAKLDRATAVLRASSDRVAAFPADVRDYDAVRSAIDDAVARFGSLDVLICGAAIDFPFPARQMSAESFRGVVETDLLGSFHASRAAFSHLKETTGCVLFISGPQASIPAAYQCHVGAAKAGVDCLMRNLALEWGPYGIRSNAISPGPVEATAGLRQLTNPEDQEALQAAIPLRRLGKTIDVANAAVFLASSLAAYITGAVIPVDGGYILNGSGLYTAIVTNHHADRGFSASDRVVHG